MENLKPVHNKLFKLIQDYEQRNWSDSENITEEQFEQAETAEQLVEIKQA